MSRSGSQSEDTENEDRFSFLAENMEQEDWLTESLPNLTHFTTILPRIYPLILRACLVETNLKALQGYINFLTQYPPHEKLYQSAVEMSRVMVDRFPTVRKLFADGDSIDSLSTFRSVLGMLRHAFEEALESQTSPELSGSSDFLLINFPNVGRKGIIHLALVEAIFLFISCKIAQRSNPADFKYFTELWFPSNSIKNPEAFTVETKEPVPLPPVSVLPQMLFSTESKVLDAVISLAAPLQLCSFIQQFGCRSESVEKSLRRLDECCADRETAVTLRRSINDPIQVANSIEVHFLRGIEAGKAFHTYLQGLSDIPPTDLPSNVTAILEADDEKSVPSKISKEEEPLPLYTSVVELGKISAEKMEQYLLNIFTPTLSQTDLAAEDIQQEIETGLKKLIFATRKLTSSELQASKDSINAEISTLVTALHKLLTGGGVRRQFLEGMIKNQFSLSLLRMLTKLYTLTQLEDLFQSIIKQIMNLLESKRMSSISGLSVFRSVVLGCAEQLGITRDTPDDPLPFSDLTSTVKNACVEVKASVDPFEKEEALVKMASDVVQSGCFALVEDILSTVAKRAIALGMETRCISFLQKIKIATSTVQAPLILQCFPGLLSKKGYECEKDDLNVMEVNEQSMNMVVIGDLSGLFVDWLEILDPQVRLSHDCIVYRYMHTVHCACRTSAIVFT